MSILLTRPPGAPRQTLAEYRDEGGYEALERVVSAGAPQSVLAEIDAAGLRGRGGAAFPVVTKWRLAAEQDAAEKFVVANGGEHEPGSAKDKYLVERYPHKVLEGMALCGFATGARRGYLYLIEDMAGPLASAEQALAEVAAAGLFGERFDIEIHRAPTTYVAGEETAALESIEGNPAKPRIKPPYPGVAGLFGLPTTVNNVETLAHAAYVVRHGSVHYRTFGTPESTGTMLFTLGAQVQRPGVYELPFGATFRTLIEECGGGVVDGRAIRGILPALSCGFVSGEHLDASIDHASLKALGSSVGCGGVSLVLEGDDVVARVLEIAEFFMAEQCGLCPPCRMETNQMVHVLKGVVGGGGPGYERKLEKLAAFARGKGRCSLVEMAAAPVLSALRLFGAEFALAAAGGS